MTDSPGVYDGASLVEETDEGELAEVLRGLSSRPRRISTKYHYDARGSALFEEITRLDEYYLTRTERRLLEVRVPDWVARARPRTLVELGAGTAEKSRIVLDAMASVGCADAYVPVDVAGEVLSRTAQALRRDYEGLHVVPEVADIGEPLNLSPNLPHPRWIAFLGSTLGNFEDDEAVGLLSRVASRLEVDDRFLLGVDLRPGDRKTVERVEAAYNDPHGVTSRFALNILSVVNDRFGSDFDLDGFRHRSVYVPETGRIETDLVARTPQVVTFADGTRFDFAEGEEIRTEISAKYDRPTVEDLFARAGLGVERWAEDEEGLYALALGRPLG